MAFRRKSDSERPQGNEPNSVRKEFEIATLDGRRDVLAHVDIKNSKRLGKYGVNLPALDDIAASSIEDAVAAREIVVIDEIGPMEISSKRFRDAVMHALQSESLVLATIVKRSTPFTEKTKQCPALLFSKSGVRTARRLQTLLSV